MFERFREEGLEVVYIGPFETTESCEEWRREYDLAFPVVPDTDGTLFRRLTSGWVPWSILLAPDGEVVFSENEFDEEGFAAAIGQLLAKQTKTASAARSTKSSERSTRRPASRSRIRSRSRCAASARSSRCGRCC